MGDAISQFTTVMTWTQISEISWAPHGTCQLMGMPVRSAFPFHYLYWLIKMCSPGLIYLDSARNINVCILSTLGWGVNIPGMRDYCISIWTHGDVMTCERSPHPLQWRHNGLDGVSNHQPNDCVLYRYIKNQSSASLAFVRGNHRWPLNSPHKGPVTRKMFPFDDVIMHWSFVRIMPLTGGFISQRASDAGLWCFLCYVLWHIWQKFEFKMTLHWDSSNMSIRHAKYSCWYE